MYTPYNFGYDNWPLLSSFKVEIFLKAASAIKVFRDNKHKYNYCTGSKHQWLSLFKIVLIQAYMYTHLDNNILPTYEK